MPCEILVLTFFDNENTLVWKVTISRRFAELKLEAAVPPKDVNPILLYGVTFQKTVNFQEV